MSDLVAFVRVCLDEDERVARAAKPGPWSHLSPYDEDDGDGDAEGGVYDSHGNIFVYPEGSVTRFDARHIARHDPARVLAEVAAKRAILELHDGEHQCRELVTGVYPHDWPSAAPWGSAGEAWRHASSEHFEGPCPTLRLLAQPYAGREGWREEWATGGAA
jgi:hypothetical protein